VYKLYISLPKKWDKREIAIIRVPCKKRQKAIKVTWKEVQEIKSEEKKDG
jgi:hypothetical protein